jgi:hypothetical protein
MSNVKVILWSKQGVNETIIFSVAVIKSTKKNEAVIRSIPNLV